MSARVVVVKPSFVTRIRATELGFPTQWKDAVYRENPSRLRIVWDHHEGGKFIYSRDEESVQLRKKNSS